MRLGAKELRCFHSFVVDASYMKLFSQEKVYQNDS